MILLKIDEQARAKSRDLYKRKERAMAQKPILQKFPINIQSAGKEIDRER
jgi:hypothetical protein